MVDFMKSLAFFPFQGQNPVWSSTVGLASLDFNKFLVFGWDGVTRGVGVWNVTLSMDELSQRKLPSSLLGLSQFTAADSLAQLYSLFLVQGHRPAWCFANHIKTEAQILPGI